MMDTDHYVLETSHGLRMHMTPKEAGRLIERLMLESQQPNGNPSYFRFVDIHGGDTIICINSISCLWYSTKEMREAAEELHEAMKLERKKGWGDD